MRVPLGFIFFVLALFPVRAATTVQQHQLWIYLVRADAEQHEKSKDYLGAVARYRVAETMLLDIHQRDPDWESQLVAKCAKDCQDQILRLKPLAKAQVPMQPLPNYPTNLDSSQGAAESLAEYLSSLEILQSYDTKWRKDEIAGMIAKANGDLNHLVAKLDRGFFTEFDGRKGEQTIQ
jgi:hypothetical protein